MVPAVVPSYYDQNGQTPLQRHAQRFPYNEVKLRSVSHSPRPFDQKHGGRGEVMSSPSVVRKNQERVTKREATSMVAEALRAAFKGQASPLKRIQDIALVDRKTAEKWWHGRSAPGIQHLFNMMRQIPELAGEVRRLTAMHADLDPEFDRAFNEMQQLYQRMVRR